MIQNKTKKTILSDEYKVAQTFLDKAFGLLFSSNPRAMLFKTHFGIHTFFMRDKIDVVILNNQNRVASLKVNLLPNRIFIWNPKFNLVLELPNGVLKKSRTEVGDTISFLPQK